MYDASGIHADRSAMVLAVLVVEDASRLAGIGFEGASVEDLLVTYYQEEGSQNDTVPLERVGHSVRHFRGIIARMNAGGDLERHRIVLCVGTRCDAFSNTKCARTVLRSANTFGDESLQNLL